MVTGDPAVAKDGALIGKGVAAVADTAKIVLEAIPNVTGTESRRILLCLPG
jgi:hypothetical protein